jgi:hypothetical protein
MIKRAGGYYTLRKPDDAPVAAAELESQGCVILRQAFNNEEIDCLQAAVTEIFDTYPPDDRTYGTRGPEGDAMFRYEMLNRNDICQRAVSHSSILDVIEPLLGEDCHVIANTAWRNPPKPNDPSQGWHVDAGPHIPMAEGVSWPTDIPHPVFAIGAHIFLQDCHAEDGPTGVIPGSHLSGRFPPWDQAMDPALTFNDQSAVELTCDRGDVALFVSDVWHRRLPTGANDQGRFFLQVHYGRRDIQQRLRRSMDSNQLSEEAISRATDHRSKTVIGLHHPGFYDG